MLNKNTMTHSEMANEMLLSIGLLPDGIDVNTPGMIRQVDEFAMENDFHFDGKKYVSDFIAFGVERKVVRELHKRAIQLSIAAEFLSNKLLENDNEFTRMRLEVVARQNMDAWTSYYNASARLA